MKKELWKQGGLLRKLNEFENLIIHNISLGTIYL